MLRVFRPVRSRFTGLPHYLLAVLSVVGLVPAGNAKAQGVVPGRRSLTAGFGS